jgi:CubicO group peptidase (beta-lactamase class C family)
MPVFILCLIIQAVVYGAVYFPPPGETMVQQSQKTPAEVGLNSAIINDLSGIASRWAIWRHGYLIHVSGDFNSETEVKSLRKTWHSLTVGTAIKQGKIPSYDQKISVWQTELTGNDANATWWHVMTQSAGFDYPGCGHSTDYEPGQMWTYSDYNPYHLCNALAKAYGRNDYYDNYSAVIKEAFFDSIGMQGWSTSTRTDGIRFNFDLEDMGRLGLLVLARGKWEGREIVPQWFVEELETNQTAGMLVNYDGCNDGDMCQTTSNYPEIAYGYMTWVNSEGDVYTGADPAWAWGAGAGGTLIMWNWKNGIVVAAVGYYPGCPPTSNGIPQIVERNILGPNPLMDDTTRMVGKTGTRTDYTLKISPNPFYSVTRIAVINQPSTVSNFSLKIFDINGKMVNDFYSSIYHLPSKGLSWNASHLVPGIYIITLQQGKRTWTTQAVLIR